MKHRHHPMKWLIWGFASLFYLYEVFLRTFPSVMVNELMQAFSINATSVGVLSAIYFYVIAPMQLPVGILTDRYGPRKLLTMASIIAGLGTLLFALTTLFSIAAIGRFLMGFGSAFGFVGLIYISSHWFPPHRRPLMIGLGNSIGMLGAILGEGPMRIWLNHFGWRPTLEYYGIVGIVLGIILFLVIRNAPSEEKKNQTKENFHSSDFFLNLKIVSKNRRSWIIAFVAAFFYVTTSTFGALWGVPFLHTKYGIQIDTAGFIISLIYVGWIVVGPVIGHFSKNIEQKLLFLLFGSALAFFLISIIIYVPGIPLGVVGILLFLVGGISSAQLLCFSYAMLINPDEVKATASALTNCLSKGLAALMQTFVGFLLDFNWGGQMEAGARIYSTKAYTIAMTTFPITFFIAFLLTLFLKRAQNQTQIGGNI